MVAAPPCARFCPLPGRRHKSLILPVFCPCNNAVSSNQQVRPPPLQASLVGHSVRNPAMGLWNVMAPRGIVLERHFAGLTPTSHIRYPTELCAPPQRTRRLGLRAISDRASRLPGNAIDVARDPRGAGHPDGDLQRLETSRSGRDHRPCCVVDVSPPWSGHGNDVLFRGT
jgi:hypothetical protein